MTTEQPDYTAVLEDLKAKRAQIDAAIEAIEALGAGGGSVSGTSGSRGTGASGAVIRADSFFKMSTLDAAIKYLGMVNEPKSPTEIAEALERGGLEHQSQNLGNTLYTTLSRSASHGGPVVKVGRNWGLSKWY